MRRPLLRALLLGLAGVSTMACAAFAGDDGAGDDDPATPVVPDAGPLDGAPTPAEAGGLVGIDADVDGGRGSAEGGATCGGRGTCRVFVTSGTWRGVDLGGIAGADAKCNTTATTVGLPGQFRAWIGDGVVGPASTFTRSAGPYILPGNQDKPIAVRWEDLVDESIATPINVTETGQQVESQLVWTGLGATGTPKPEHCGGWTSPLGGGIAGSTAGTSSTWSDLAPSPCSTAAHLYCVEQ